MFNISVVKKQLTTLKTHGYFDMCMYEIAIDWKVHTIDIFVSQQVF